MPESEARSEVCIYTDGGCRGNPGCGAWAAILTNSRQRRVLGGVSEHTTNNKMEITAAIEGLRALKRPCRVRFVSDSQYTINGITQWIHNWKRRGWVTKSKTPVRNKELWQALDAEAAKHEIKWEWTRGHSGHPENEACDLLANELMDRLQGGEPACDLKIDRRKRL